ncbi:hypothetical protein [Rubellimicrobium aerolatum]|uniref:SH3 domain-containing protein n=1 Tax=Rubellimicrobium aerolatum TaxID=490979 RepID=A0ABW0SB82_9RHOB|nr:hypothetical protein [Rubellimicrobium aerolatum]MBP1805461.1 hypothetical protein [Rubellimicrobium aerolatum]
MASRPLAAAFALAAVFLALPDPARAACRTEGTGARCIRVLDAPAGTGARSGSSAPSPLVQVGELVPRGRYSIILNADYYGLPPVSDGWVYMRIGADAFRVDWRTHQVLERVTDRAGANF